VIWHDQVVEQQNLARRFVFDRRTTEQVVDNSQAFVVVDEPYQPTKFVRWVVDGVVGDKAIPSVVGDDA
jgi:hypothetical protein